MDDDVKTLLAILALVYGSSNGLGLLKTALVPVETKTAELRRLGKDGRTDASTLTAARKELCWALWSPLVLVYVILVAVVPLFLFLVARYGPLVALEWIGLHSSKSTTVAPAGGAFYWVLLALSIISSGLYLSGYLKGWRALIKYRKK